MGSDRHKCNIHRFNTHIASRRDKDNDRRRSEKRHESSSERRRDRKNHKSRRSPNGSPDEYSSFKPLFFKGTSGTKIAPRPATERPKRIMRDETNASK